MKLRLVSPILCAAGSAILLLVLLGIPGKQSMLETSASAHSVSISPGLVLGETDDPFAISQVTVHSEQVYIGQRSSSLCAEHDSYVVPVFSTLLGPTLLVSTELTASYSIQATHPTTEVHPTGASWDQWCAADWTNCPLTQSSSTSEAICQDAIGTADTISKVFDNVQEQIYVLDGAPDIGTFEVIINGTSHGQHTGVILGSRWGVADSWNHDGVIYANGFTRWKPKGEAPGAETDPCFGTSVILGPFQIDEPFLADGYSPNPSRHPQIETIEITVGTGWNARLSGHFGAPEAPVLDAEWVLARINIDSTEMRVSVSQHITATQDTAVDQILGQYGLGQVGLSSMYASEKVHDSDTQVGSGLEIAVGDIPSTTHGLWGQEDELHPLADGETLCLDTRTPTTHNTGSPTLCILWNSGTITYTSDLVLEPDLARTALPGSTISYTHVLTNSGGYTDTFDLAHQSDQNWTVQYSTPITLGSGQSRSIVVSTTVPVDAGFGAVNVTALTATVRSEPSLSDTVLETTRVDWGIYLPAVLKGMSGTGGR